MKNLEDITYEIIGAAYKVHKNIGPGALESVYEECLKYEMQQKGLKVKQQILLPIHYKGKILEKGFRVDLLINNLVIVEIKSVEFVKEIHLSQLLTYIKLGKKKRGLLLNFNVPNMQSGIYRRANG